MAKNVTTDTDPSRTGLIAPPHVRFMRCRPRKRGDWRAHHAAVALNENKFSPAGGGLCRMHKPITETARPGAPRPTPAPRAARDWRWRGPRLGIGWRLGLGLAAVTTVLVLGEVLAARTTREALAAVRSMQNEHEPLANSANAVLEKLLAYDRAIDEDLQAHSPDDFSTLTQAGDALEAAVAGSTGHGDRHPPAPSAHRPHRQRAPARQPRRAARAVGRGAPGGPQPGLPARHLRWRLGAGHQRHTGGGAALARRARGGLQRRARQRRHTRRDGAARARLQGGGECALRGVREIPRPGLARPGELSNSAE